MTIIRNIGKNTLGDKNKMSVRLHSYYMSNHDLSFELRNTQIRTSIKNLAIMDNIPLDEYWESVS